MYVVIKMFDDLQDMQVVGGIRTYHRYRPGDAYPREGYRPTSERVRELLSGRNALRTPLIAIPDDVREGQGQASEKNDADQSVKEIAEAAKETAKAAREMTKAAKEMAKARPRKPTSGSTAKKPAPQKASPRKKAGS